MSVGDRAGSACLLCFPLASGHVSGLQVGSVKACGLTQRAPDGWESPRFWAVFLAEAGSVKVALPRPAHPRVTQTVRHLSCKEHG